MAGNPSQRNEAARSAVRTGPTGSPESIAAVVLDFDGLILDTETPIFEAWQAAYRRHGQPLGLDLWESSLGTHGTFDPLAHLEALCPGGFDPGAVRAEVDADIARGCEAQPLMPGIAGLLREAGERGLRRAVASSSSSRWVEGWLHRHGIRSQFEAVATRDQVKQVKPDPELFLLAARQLGVRPERCVVFEDSANGMRAALAAGMRCVAVPNALTRRLPRPEVDLALASLAERSLADILSLLEGAPPIAGSIGPVPPAE